MISAVDSSVLFDIVKGSDFAQASLAALSDAHQRGVVCICAPVVAELGRYFPDAKLMRAFFADAGIQYSEISLDVALAAAKCMNEYAANNGARNRVAADFLIGAHAKLQADVLVTRDAGFHREYFKGLKIINPTA